jgi:serine/threonine-protein kinase ULK/ATG1
LVSWIFKNILFFGKNMNHDFVIGPYHCLGKRIGTGSYSSVYLGERKSNKERVAIKVIDLYQLASRNPRDSGKLKMRLNIETQIARECSHSNLISLLDVFYQEEHVYLIFEYCSGGDLSNYLQLHGRCSEDVAREIFRQIICGMCYLQSKSILHRDLKPQNLLLSPNPENPIFPYTVKIADFGFAKKVEPDVLSDTICGSPLYMAPELFDREKYSDKIDSWSLGVILYEILVGKQPIFAKSQYELMYNIKHNKIRIPKSLSEPCKELLMGLLRKNEKDRMTIKQISNHPFLNTSSNTKLEDTFKNTSLSSNEPLDLPFPKNVQTKHSKQPVSFLKQMFVEDKPSQDSKILTCRDKDVSKTDFNCNLNSNYNYKSNCDSFLGIFDVYRSDRIMNWLYCVKILEYIFLETEFCSSNHIVLLKDNLQHLNIKITIMVFSMQLLQLTKNNILYNIHENNMRMNKKLCGILGFIDEKYSEFYSFVSKYQSKINIASPAPNLLNRLVNKVQEYKEYFKDKKKVFTPEDFTKVKNSLALIDLLELYVIDEKDKLNEWKKYFLEKKRQLTKYGKNISSSNSFIK